MASGATPANLAAPASEHDMLMSIVEETNLVLGRSYTLVDFDELSPVKMLQIVSDIFAALSPPMAVDFNTEPQDQGAMKLMEFLIRTLGYKVPPMIQATYPQDFINAEKTVMYPTLYWVLKRMPENRKRVYLAKYLQRIDVPDELRFQDPEFNTLYER